MQSVDWQGDHWIKMEFDLIGHLVPLGEFGKMKAEMQKPTLTRKQTVLCISKCDMKYVLKQQEKTCLRVCSQNQ